MTITLSPVDEEIVKQLVASGRCRTEEDVIHLSLSLLQDDESLRESDNAVLRARLQHAADQIARGDFHSLEESRLRSARLYEELTGRSA